MKVVEESGQTTDECLPLSPDSARIDLAAPTFSNPTSITNPLHPTSRVDQAVYGGHVDGMSFRTEVSLMPGARPISLQGRTIDTTTVQYMAYLDGRVHEVAMDYYAQADDGSVWYFGEDVSNYEDGKVADTNGTWQAGDQTPAAMIMPAEPRVGSVYRSENAPGIAFEEVRVDEVGLEVPGFSGPITGAIHVTELHMDGSREGKLFAPGYGEYSTGDPTGDVETASLAVPTDAGKGPAPPEFGAFSAAVGTLYTAAADNDTDLLRRTTPTVSGAWDELRAKRISGQMESQMRADLDALNHGVSETDWESARSAALRIAQNETDLRLLYQRVVDVDLARLKLWTRQLSVDARDENASLALSSVAALERIWERTRHGVEPDEPTDASMRQLRSAADAGDLYAMNQIAVRIGQVLDELRSQ